MYSAPSLVEISNGIRQVVDRHVAVAHGLQPWPAGTLRADHPTGVALHLEEVLHGMVRAAQHGEIAPAELGLIVQADADEGREAAERQAARRILEEGRVVAAAGPGVAGAEVLRARRLPVIDLVLIARQGAGPLTVQVRGEAEVGDVLVGDAVAADCR